LAQVHKAPPKKKKKIKKKAEKRSPEKAQPKTYENQANIKKLRQTNARKCDELGGRRP